MKPEIYLEVSGHVGEIVLNRPGKLNTLTAAMFKLLRDVCEQANDDPQVHVILLRGEGQRAFCAGTDINTLATFDGPWAWRNRVDYVTQIRALRKPVIACIAGWALGGGLELAVAADIRFAADTAVFGAPEVSLGWIGAGGTSQFLPRLIGYGQAMKLLVSGERIDAAEALRIGLVEEVVPADALLERARAYAARIAAHSPIATQAVKSSVRAAMFGSLEGGLQIENELMAMCFALGADKAGAARFAQRSRD
jgi:enoyl-CoA hydratase